MKWDDFCNHFDEWTEATIQSRISALEEMGDGESVAKVAFDLPTGRLKAHLIRKAISLNVDFMYGTYFNLVGTLPDDVCLELAEHIGSDLDPSLDEDNLSWEDFHFDCCAWSEKNLLRRIYKLKNFGSPEEVCDAVCTMPNTECEEALFKRAVAAGVKFSEEQLQIMGQDVEKEEKWEEDWLYSEEPVKTGKKGLGFWGSLFVLGGALLDEGSSKKKDPGRCDGDCANCPPHYGYRYGRWYYGRGHRHGCQRGGNGGATSSKSDFH